MESSSFILPRRIQRVAKAYCIGFHISTARRSLQSIRIISLSSHHSIVLDALDRTIATNRNILKAISLNHNVMEWRISMIGLSFPGSDRCWYIASVLVVGILHSHRFVVATTVHTISYYCLFVWIVIVEL